MGLVSQCGHGRRQAQGCLAGEGGEKLSYKETSSWCLVQAGDGLSAGGSSKVWGRIQRELAPLHAHSDAPLRRWGVDEGVS